MCGDIMFIINILAGDFTGWCSETGVQNAFHLIKTVLEVLRIVVPIGLIVMTTLDIVKKVINPDEKDGQKKIMTRAIAAIIVFFIPTIITIVFRLIDIGKGTSGSYNESQSSLSACWR